MLLFYRRLYITIKLLLSIKRYNVSRYNVSRYIVQYKNSVYYFDIEPYKISILNVFVFFEKIMLCYNISTVLINRYNNRDVIDNLVYQFLKLSNNEMEY